MTPMTLQHIFEWFTVAELLLTRVLMFLVFLYGLWQLLIHLKSAHSPGSK
jgi:hypothetical protein